MKPLCWWMPIVGAIVALAFGLWPYGLLNSIGKMPLGLRDHPWPLELVAVAAAAFTAALAARAYRQKRVRVVATVSAVVAVVATVGFLMIVHVVSYRLPPPPAELAVGTVAPDFTLPDETGEPVALSSLRGGTTLLVFYRGFW